MDLLGLDLIDPGLRLGAWVSGFGPDLDVSMEGVEGSCAGLSFHRATFAWVRGCRDRI